MCLVVGYPHSRLSDAGFTPRSRIPLHWTITSLGRDNERSINANLTLIRLGINFPCKVEHYYSCLFRSLTGSVMFDREWGGLSGLRPFNFEALLTDYSFRIGKRILAASLGHRQ